MEEACLISLLKKKSLIIQDEDHTSMKALLCATLRSFGGPSQAGCTPRTPCPGAPWGRGRGRRQSHCARGPGLSPSSSALAAERLTSLGLGFPILK